MSSDEKFVRRYSDKEVNALIKRATELQEEDATPSRGDSRAGMTLVELQEIAAEAGIDPKLIQRAAAHVDIPRTRTVGEKFAGAPFLVSVERVVPGELSAAAFSRIVPEIQRVATGHGNASMVGRTLTWSSETSQGQRSFQVTVSAKDGETLIRAEERLHGLAGSLYGGLMGGLGGGLGFGLGMPIGIEVLGSAAFAVGFPIAVIGGSYLIARTILRKTGRERKRTLTGLVDHIADQVEAEAAGQLKPANPAQHPD
ncbi:MAG: hypothetical protein ACR2QM_01710 [Longimicrobiales bacterium]